MRRTMQEIAASYWAMRKAEWAKHKPAKSGEAMPDTITIEMIYQEAPEIRRIVKHAEMLRKSGEGDPRFNVWDHYSALKREAEQYVGWHRVGEGPGWLRNEPAHTVAIRAIADALRC